MNGIKEYAEIVLCDIDGENISDTTYKRKILYNLIGTVAAEIKERVLNDTKMYSFKTNINDEEEECISISRLQELFENIEKEIN
jgi:hypothetical protein